MLKDLRGVSIDRERAIRAIALIGLLILGLATLPGLLKTPDPPPVPPDVGFTTQELARFAEQPLPVEKTTEPKGRPRVRQQARQDPPRRAHRPEGDKKKSHSKSRSEGQATTVETAPSTPAVPAYSAPPPAPSPPVAVSPPPYSPPAPPAPPPVPADGSQEFAPR